MLNLPRSDPEESFDLNYFIDVWEGTQHDYGSKALIGTIALALFTLQKSDNMDDAMQTAKQMWTNR